MVLGESEAGSILATHEVAREHLRPAGAVFVLVHAQWASKQTISTGYVNYWNIHQQKRVVKSPTYFEL